MGFFDKIRANLEEANRRGQLINEMKKTSREADLNRPGIAGLDFKVLDPSIGNDPRYTNSGYIQKLGVDDFLECIRSGRAQYAEVAVVSTRSFIIATEHNTFTDEYKTTERVYAKVADMNGTVYRETVMTAKNSGESEWPANFWDENYKNPDTVSVSELQHAYVLHYYIRGTEYYLLADPNEFNDLSKLFLRLKNGPKAECLEIDSSCDCWW